MFIIGIDSNLSGNAFHAKLGSLARVLLLVIFFLPLIGRDTSGNLSLGHLMRCVFSRHSPHSQFMLQLLSPSLDKTV